MKTKTLLLFIIILAFLLRAFALSDFPPTLYGDEQAFSWNAYNILHLGEDEYGARFPLQFRSFEDYKAPIPVYLLVPFIKLFGLNAFSIRLPIAIFSALTILATFFLVNQFFKKKLSLLASFLFAISPWHIHLSRAFFESTLSLFFFVSAIYFFVKSRLKLKELLLSMAFLALTLYSYFSPRILIPIFLLFLICYGLKYLRDKKEYLSSGKVVKNIIISLCVLLTLSLPCLKLTFFDKGFSRFDKLSKSMNEKVVKIVNNQRYASNLPDNLKMAFHNKATVTLNQIKNNYLEHLSINFLFISGDSSLRYFLGNMGMLYLMELPFFVIGLYFLWKNKKRVALFFTLWMLLAPIPASLVGRPFAVRSLALLPAPFVFISYGIYSLLSILNKNHIFKKIFIFLITTVASCSLMFVCIRYYFEYPIYAATWWGYENKAALDYAKKHEAEYDKIFLSNFYSGMDLAFAVYNNIDPMEYRQAKENPIDFADGRKMYKIGKYYIGSLDLNRERLDKNIIPAKSLYIGRPEEPEGSEAITAPDDGRLIFVIHKKK